jgi:hypothetical protein
MDQLSDTLALLESLGITLPSRAYLIGVTLFSIIGFIGYRYGKKRSLQATKWIGIALMFYPYVIWETWLLYVVGAGLCVGLYFSSHTQ